jgi:hypothetical protein
VVGVGNEITSDETVHESKHRVLHGADSIEMPAVTNGMFWSVNCVRDIGAHDPEKINISLNTNGRNPSSQSGTWGKQNRF